MWQLIR